MKLHELNEMPVTPSLRLAVFDGLLALLATTPGIRILSVADLIRQKKQRPGVINDALRKVNTVLSRWEKYLARESDPADGWVATCLSDYDPHRPRLPQPAQKHKKRHPDLSVLMTLDPGLSYSSSQPVSDGRLTQKTNIAIQNTRYATPLAFIGASRTLRGQPVAANRVNFYVPLLTRGVFTADHFIPLLEPSPVDYAWATINTMLTLVNNGIYGQECLSIGFQTLQRQGASQSISIDHGFVDCSWLVQLASTVGWPLLRHWQYLTSRQPELWPYELNALPDVLSRRSRSAWLRHLRDLAHAAYSGKTEVRSYSIQETKEITKLMRNGSQEIPLTTILNRPNGTLRFGHAIRLLERENRGAVQDILARLDPVRTADQLLRTMAILAQECSIASGPGKFIIVPNDDDFEPLLDDIENFGPQTVASMLIIISALRYPPSSKDKNGNTPPTSNENTNPQVETEEEDNAPTH